MTKSVPLLTALPSGFVNKILTFCPFVKPVVPVVKATDVALVNVTDVAVWTAPLALCNSIFGIDAKLVPVKVTVPPTSASIVEGEIFVIVGCV